MRYFEQYKKLIDEGKIAVCKEMKLAIKRIDRFKKEYIFKQEEADKRIAFIENECSNTKGVRGPLKLALPQKVWVETAWGFYHKAKIIKTDPVTMEEFEVIEERRLIHEIPIIVSRGCGKTTLGSAIAEVGQIADGEYGADVNILAYTREQAGYLYNANRAMLNNENSILYLLRQADELSSTKQGLLYRPTNSLMTIKTADYESLDGTNAHYNFFDEVHTYDDDFIKVVNDGSAKKRKNWQTWYLTTNGTKRDSVFDRYYNKWIDILKGKTVNDTVMPFIYKLDSIEEINDPKMWVKAIPLLGITVEREAVALDIATSKNDPTAQAELLAKTFNIPTNNFLAYFTNEECLGNKSQFDNSLFVGTKENKAKCVLGIDLSDVNDICSISFEIIKGEKRFFKALKFMPRRSIEKLPRAQAEKYEEWEQEGKLHLHEKDHNDQEYIFNYIKDYMNENNIFPICVGYDKWNSREIRRYFEEYYGDICVEIQQTTKGLSNYLKVYKEKLGAGNIIFDDPVMTWCHMNVQVKVDANMNVFPNKKKAKDKIDVFASNLDAFIAYELKKEDLYFYFN